MIGQTLAHYRVTAAIGAGGMGEVYRATDPKLGNDDGRDYDVTPDGQRFLLARRADRSDSPLIAVLGFDQILTRTSPSS
jgi:serine/threonine protein kinase